MDKIKELVKGIGGSDDLADALCEEMDRWKDGVRNKLEEEYKKKATLARQMCLEAVEKEKMLLARRLRIYLESKERKVAEAAARQHAIEEAESACTLRRVKALVEDIDIDDGGTSRKLQEAQKKLARLERAHQALREEKAHAISKANKSYGIARELIQQNRELSQKLTTLNEAHAGRSCPKCGKPACTCPEGECTCTVETCACPAESSKKGKAITESKQKDKSKKRRVPPRRRAVDEGRRKPGKTRSTRPTLVESQVRGNNSNPSGGSDKVIDHIASQMPED